MNDKYSANSPEEPEKKDKFASKKAKLIAQRKAQILSAARSIFAENGYRRTKIDEIAKYLNIGKGTIYRYFTDKKALFLSVFEQGMADLSSSIASKVEQADSPTEKFRMAITTYFDFFDANRDMIEIMMQVRSEFKLEYHQGFRSSYSQYIVKIQENLRNGVKIGVFRDMDIERTAEAYSGMLHGVLQGLYIRQYENKSENAETLTDKAEPVLALMLNGILKKDVY